MPANPAVPHGKTEIQPTIATASLSIVGRVLSATMKTIKPQALLENTLTSHAERTHSTVAQARSAVSRITVEHSDAFGRRLNRKTACCGLTTGIPGCKLSILIKASRGLQDMVLEHGADRNWDGSPLRGQAGRQQEISFDISLAKSSLISAKRGA